MSTVEARDLFRLYSSPEGTSVALQGLTLQSLASETTAAETTVAEVRSADAKTANPTASATSAGGFFS